MSKVIKIALRTKGEESWRGSISTHHEGLLHALRETYGNKVQFCFVAEDEHSVPESLTEYAGSVLVLPRFGGTSKIGLTNKIVNKFFFCNPLVIEHLLKREGIDILIDIGTSLRIGRIPLFSYILDFRHIHLPESYDSYQRKWLENSYRQASETAARIILTSETVKKDFLSFFPKHTHKARVLRPVSHIPLSIYEEDSKSIAVKYHLPEKFVYLPNQFWRHKNYSLVFQALRRLNSKGIKIFIVLSGSPKDSCHEAIFYSDLLREISQWGIRDQIAFLGFIPHQDVLLLMRQSVCVLNPSLFEGYGLTVDEARSVGKRILASDIPAHREQAPPSAAFFNPRDAGELAWRLEEIWHGRAPGPDEKLEREARAVLPQRIRHYAESVIRVVKEVVS